MITFLKFRGVRRRRSRNSHRECSMEKAVLKNFGILTEKYLRWRLFLIKLQNFRPATLLKREPNTGVFLWTKKKNDLVSGNAGDEKNLHPGGFLDKVYT